MLTDMKRQSTNYAENNLLPNLSKMTRQTFKRLSHVEENNIKVPTLHIITLRLPHSYVLKTEPPCSRLASIKKGAY